MNKHHKELLYKHNKIQDEYLKNKKIENVNIFTNNINNNYNNKSINNNIFNEIIEINNINKYVLVVDNINYKLIKTINNFNSSKNKYITYKQIYNNTNYRETWPKKYSKICFLCGQKLITNNDNKENKPLYFCEFCDKIELNYNSVIYLNNKKIDLHSIIWNEKYMLSDEIITINSNIFLLDSNNYICIEKKIEKIKIDNIEYSIIWYYKDNNYYYSFIKGYKYFEIYNNSTILYNNTILPIYISKYDSTYYKLKINNINLIGNRYRPDLNKIYK